MNRPADIPGRTTAVLIPNRTHANDTQNLCRTKHTDTRDRVQSDAFTPLKHKIRLFGGTTITSENPQQVIVHGTILSALRRPTADDLSDFRMALKAPPLYNLMTLHCL
jgi:hypothetical protein